eukprot:12923929-Prorocentrum_lima.AAC.1
MGSALPFYPRGEATKAGGKKPWKWGPKAQYFDHVLEDVQEESALGKLNRCAWAGLRGDY